MRTAADLLTRFKKYVDTTVVGCWLCTCRKDGEGYGRIKVAGKLLSMHRIAWMLFRGPIPPGKLVLHKCPGGSRRACCNPAHLYLGNQKQNMEDMVREGRHGSITCPDKIGNHKLTTVQLAILRRDTHIRSGILATRFGVSRQTIWARRKEVS